MKKRTLIAQTPNLIDQKVRLKGWVNVRRDHGKIVFVDLRDRSGVIQMVLSAPGAANIQKEWVVEVEGTVQKRPAKLINTKLATGTVEISVDAIKVLAQAKPMPFDLGKDKLDLELPTLLDNRSLTLRHGSVRRIFEIQQTIVQTFRSFMQSQDFTEFQAPTIVATATEGGSEVFPVKYFDHTVYLAQSPQFYKQIMVSIFERVFTVAHAYRAEPSVTTRHMTEYIGLDVEFGFIDYWLEIPLMADSLIKKIFTAVAEKNLDDLKFFDVAVPKTINKTPTIKLSEALEIIYQTTGRDIRGESDLDPQGERDLWHWALKEHGSEILIVTHYPTKKRPMYTYPDPDNPQETYSFDIIGRGVEWVTGGQRINDYNQLIKNIKKFGYKPADFEVPYLQAFKYGMPPEGGFCLGLERITQNLLKLPNIRQATLFPRDMERVDVRLATL